MRELEFQQALAKFLTDPGARRAVLKDDQPRLGDNGEMVEGFGGSLEARTLLRGLDRGRTMLFSHLLLLNRLTKIVDALPCTSWALGVRLWDIVQAYNVHCPPQNPKKYDEALNFVEFLQHTLSAAQLSPPWLEDVLRYERNVLELRFLAERPPPVGRPLQRIDHDNLNRVRPRRSITARTVAFDYDLEGVFAAFAEGRPAPKIDASRSTLLLQVLPDGTIQQDSVNRATAELLDACSGELSIIGVAEQLADRLGQPTNLDRFRNQCVDICVVLASRGVLSLEE